MNCERCHGDGCLPNADGVTVECIRCRGTGKAPKPAIILSFDEDGSAQCVHTDALPLEALGRMTVRRASTVEFNPDAQTWEVRWEGSAAVVFSDASRSECIRWEVEQLNQKLPFSK